MRRHEWEEENGEEREREREREREGERASEGERERRKERTLCAIAATKSETKRRVSAVAIAAKRENVPLREEVILKDQSELNSSRILRWYGMKVPTPCESSSKSERRPWAARRRPANPHYSNAGVPWIQARCQYRVEGERGRERDDRENRTARASGNVSTLSFPLYACSWGYGHCHLWGS